MPLALQAKILRLVQEQTFERVGGAETVRTDVRLMRASHPIFETPPPMKSFRPDLYTA